VHIKDVGLREGAIRFRSLDALRGLASFAVVIHHWILAFPVQAWVAGLSLAAGQDNAPRLLPAVYFFGSLGRPAVMIFFVLSGFVLALSLESKRDTYQIFLLKRVFRIYPPFAFAIFLSVCLYFLVRPSPIGELSPWLNNASWDERPTPALVGAHLVMWGKPEVERLNNVMWTLVHEMRISLAFPAIFYLVRRNLWPSLAGSAVIAAIASASFKGAVIHHPLAADWMNTFKFQFLFFAGAALARRHGAIKSWMNVTSSLARGVLWCLALACLFLTARDSIMFAGAIGLVALCFADATAVRVLEHRALLYLGRIPTASIWCICRSCWPSSMHFMAGGRIGFSSRGVLRPHSRWRISPIASLNGRHKEWAASSPDPELGAR
jgi:peptidoglycan/LPS O-acetylase OafA/YrhL